MSKNIAQDLSNDLKKKINGFKAIGFCSLETKKNLFSETLDDKIDIELICVNTIDLINLKLYAMEVVGVKPGVNHVIVSLNDETHVTIMLGNNKGIIFLIIHEIDVEINEIKKIVKLYKDKLEKILGVKQKLRIV